jgi:2-oxoisovalerate dehydrogenase E1 component
MQKDDKKRILAGIILTRATDNALKHLFMTGKFQGKGFRSLGQEAIYAAGYALKKLGQKDVIAPVIRDLGAILAFTDHDVALAINAQMGRAGLPFDGRDLHVGDLSCGVLPPAAPLAIATATVTGMALAMKHKKEQRIGVSFIGEGGTSLGEWHESINFAAVQKLPMIFCVENNQTALSTPVSYQSAAKQFSDKALGYGMPGKTLDGTDPEAIFEAFTWGADHARAGHGPVLLELVSMRFCGHAHHDDMLYWGKESELSFDLPDFEPTGYIDKKAYAIWKKKDPLKTYAEQLIKEGICSQQEVEDMKKEAVAKCEAAVEEVKARGEPVVSLFPCGRGIKGEGFLPRTPRGEAKTYLEAIALGVQEILTANKNAYVLGEDVAPPYGNAFMLFKSLPKELWPQFINTPISENIIIGASVGMALEGMLPIAEMQFNDFVASGFNQLVNNAAKFRYRTGQAAPFILRMPWGGLRRAGPYHSQDTSAWFYRTPGLLIAVPSTPSDARALLHAAAHQKDPVLFYEHIALYRDPALREVLSNESLNFGQAALRKEGNSLTVISYGAYVHKAVEALKEIDCDILDLRTLVPLDFDSITQSIQKTGRVLLVGEDSKTGSVLESIASKIAENLFGYLDAPIQVLGSKDTPVPYAPTLEDDYLVSAEAIKSTAVRIMSY